MDYQYIRMIAREVVGNFFDGYFDYKECPKCGVECSMVKVRIEPKDPDSDYVFKWRCLNCLGVFTEELKESD